MRTRSLSNLSPPHGSGVSLAQPDFAKVNVAEKETGAWKALSMPNIVLYKLAKAA